MTVLVGLTMNAQKIVEKTLDHNNQFVDLDVKFANHIEVKTWEKNTIYFKASIYTADPKFQDLHKIDFDTNSSVIRIESKAEPVFKAYREDCLKNNPNRKNHCYNTGDMTEFNYTLYVPKNARFKISSINGDLQSEVIEGDFEADLINGNIEIARYAGDLQLSTINGEIDLKMDNADVVAETIHGDIYADAKLKFNSANRHVGQKISGSLGKATNRIRLNTINGNMYLRL